MTSLPVVKYDITEAAISEIRQKYSGLKIVDTASYKTVSVAIAEVRSKRIAVEERRKELKKDALEYGRLVDSEAKRITSLLQPIEEELKAEKQKEDDRKAKIKAEKEAQEKARVDGIRSRIVSISTPLMSLTGKTSQEIAKIILATDQLVINSEYAEFELEAERVKADTLTELRKAYGERHAWEKDEALRKAEADRLAKVAEEQAARELDLAHAEALIMNERFDLYAEKRAEEKRKAQEAHDAKIREEARNQAEKEAKEKAEQQKAKAEAEAKEKARKETLRPDKDRLIDFSEWLGTTALNTAPYIEAEKARAILQEALSRIGKITVYIKAEAEAL